MVPRPLGKYTLGSGLLSALRTPFGVNWLFFEGYEGFKRSLALICILLPKTRLWLSNFQRL